MTHIMLDLETWGTRPGCDIRSIGAVVFDPVAASPLNIGTGFNDGDGTFYIATDNPIIAGEIVNGYQNKRLRYPLTRDPETVKWWNDQSPEAQAAFVNPVDLRDGCKHFATWYYGIACTKPQEIRLWANGSHFDIPILEAVYRAVELPVPWHYRAPRDMRTITDAAGMTREEFSNYGDAHNALHDAIAQAMTVCEAYKRLGLTR